MNGETNTDADVVEGAVPGGITAVHGIEVGQAENLAALTGCTVVLCREGAVVGADVRGFAPGTRETDLCRPGTLVKKAHAILLAGGSAFGLDAAAGIMQYLWEAGIGFETGVARVPIVPGAVLFDLALGQVAWPDAAMGYVACRSASNGSVDQGCVGAGTGATVGKLLGLTQATKSGIGTASLAVDGVTVGAIVAVNAVGDIVDPTTGTIVAGARDPGTGRYVGAAQALLRQVPHGASPGSNTTIGVVATDADLTPDETSYLARVAHDGLARTIYPVHTMVDGDTIFALATGTTEAIGEHYLLRLGLAAVQAVEGAVLSAVTRATGLGGLPAARDVRG